MHIHMGMYVIATKEIPSKETLASIEMLDGCEHQWHLSIGGRLLCRCKWNHYMDSEGW